MKNKRISNERAKQLFKEVSTIMIGGFMGNGTSETICDLISESEAEGYTIIANDTAMPNVGIGKLIATHKVKKVVASHIGLNPETGLLMTQKKMQVELVPQGTLIEQIRAGGFGLGGVLTPTGLGTDVAKGKKTVTVQGKQYLLEEPMTADISVLHATIADEFGNCFFKGTTKNFNIMAGMAGKQVIVSADEIVPIGEMDMETIQLPGIFVDYILEEA